MNDEDSFSILKMIIFKTNCDIMIRMCRPSCSKPPHKFKNVLKTYKCIENMILLVLLKEN